jgi:hypothetical protein
MRENNVLIIAQNTTPGNLVVFEWWSVFGLDVRRTRSRHDQLALVSHTAELPETVNLFIKKIGGGQEPSDFAKADQKQNQSEDDEQFAFSHKLQSIYFHLIEQPIEGFCSVEDMSLPFKVSINADSNSF